MSKAQPAPAELWTHTDSSGAVQSETDRVSQRAWARHRRCIPAAARPPPASGTGRRCPRISRRTPDPARLLCCDPMPLETVGGPIRCWGRCWHWCPPTRRGGVYSR